MIPQLKVESDNHQESDNQALYETDYNQWVIETIEKLINRDFDHVDWNNLIEEISDLSRREKRKLESLLTKLFEHLLKLKYWQSEIEQNRGHWEAEIANFRKEIKRELRASPSLKNYLLKILPECYQDGREIAAKRSQISLTVFPDLPIGDMEQILDETWFP
jgi:PAS domain-containing protein